MGNFEKFINKAEIKYGKQYDYSLVEYKNSEKKVKIKCNKHDIIFEQSPASHIRGQRGCHLCVGRIDSTDKFIDKAKETHGGKYDYSNSIYIDSTIKVKILCPEHGEFEQLPVIHTKGQGCPKCGIITRSDKKRLNTQSFIEKSQLKHGEKYDYSLVRYEANKVKVKILCSKHGEFEQSPDKHMSGEGCPKCGKDSLKKLHQKDVETFIKQCRDVHGDKYDYSLVEYNGVKTKVKIICSHHGEFEQLPNDHLVKHGCVKCTSSISKDEIEINDFINGLGLETKQSSMSIINPYQLDIFIPSHNIAIEYNGLYWHNELSVGKDYHLTKTDLCEAKGIQLIHIFEDEWLNKKDIVKSRLESIFGLVKNKIYARKCEIREVNSIDSNLFLENNHLQGGVNVKIRLGLYYDNELVSLMLFNKPRIGIGSQYEGYELSRFCNKLNYNVAGGASKLLKYFIKKYNPYKIISYADRRWSTGELYEKLGFTATHINKPNYWYVVGKERKHRFGFRKNRLKDIGYDVINKTEREITLENGIYRIYDCGTICFELKNNLVDSK